MCPCEGLYICGYHAGQIRKGLREATQHQPGSQWHTAVMATLRHLYGGQRVTLITNLDRPLKETA